MDPSPREFERLTMAVDRLTGVMESLPEKLRLEMAATYVRQDVLGPVLDKVNLRIDGVEGDVADHKGWMVWAQRLVIGTVVLAVLALVIANRSGGVS